LSGQNTHHAPIIFNLACYFVCDENDSQYERIIIKWKSDIRDDLRRSLISMLPKMNSITDCADFRNRSEMNNLRLLQMMLQNHCFKNIVFHMIRLALKMQLIKKRNGSIITRIVVPGDYK
jgi:hypothetical protein